MTVKEVLMSGVATKPSERPHLQLLRGVVAAGIMASALWHSRVLRALRLACVRVHERLRERRHERLRERRQSPT